MKNCNDIIKKAFDLYSQNEAKKMPKDKNINLEFSKDFSKKMQRNILIKNKKHILKKSSILVACLTLVVCVFFTISAFIGGDVSENISLDNALSSTTSDNSQNSGILNTYYPVKQNENSRELTPYRNLDELLNYLSENDNHSQTKGYGVSFSNKTKDKKIIKLKMAVTYKNYCYSIYKNAKQDYIYHSVNMSYLNKDKTEFVKSIFSCKDISGSQGGYEKITSLMGLFIYKNKLAVVNEIGSFTSPSTSIKIYDLTNPKKPSLVNTIIQNGTYSNCYMVGSKIYLFTSDGVCACGYSRLNNKSEYIPSISSGGENINIPEENIYIMGSPSMIRYIAVSVIEADTGNIDKINAFYGDIKECYYGSDFFAFKTQFKKYNKKTAKCLWDDAEVIYIFNYYEDKFEFEGKICLNSLFGFPERNYYDNDENYENDIRSFIRIEGVYRQDEYFRIIGEYFIENIDYREEGYVIGLFNEDLNIRHLVAKEVENMFGIEEIENDEHKQILTINTYFKSCMETLFVTIDYEETIPKIYENSNLFENGISKNCGSHPKKLMINITDNIYLRCHDNENCAPYETYGFDLLDFSDPTNVNIIYKSKGELPKISRVTGNSEICCIDEDIYKIIYTTFTCDSNGRLKDPKYTLRLFSVNIEHEYPYETIYEYELGDEVEEMVKYNENYYLISKHIIEPTWLPLE